MQGALFSLSLAALLAATACGGSSSSGIAPQDGFRAQSDELTLAPGEEAQLCYFLRAPDLDGGRDYFISRTVIATGPGSHHVSLFRVRTLAALTPDRGAPFIAGATSGTFVRGGECLKSGNWADWPLVTSSSYGAAGTDEWALPAGVAHRIRPGEALMLQLHSLNLSSQPLTTRARVDLLRSKEAAPAELGVLVASQQGVRVCRSDPRPFAEGNCALPAGAAHVLAASSHFHSRGVRLRIASWDGHSQGAPADTARFYESLAWDEPPFQRGLDRAVAAGEGIYFSCEYRWREPSVGCDAVDAADPRHAGDCCFTVGPRMDVNEHCNAFVFYWPKLAEAPACALGAAP